MSQLLIIYLHFYAYILLTLPPVLTPSLLSIPPPSRKTILQRILLVTNSTNQLLQTMLTRRNGADRVMHLLLAALAKKFVVCVFGVCVEMCDFHISRCIATEQLPPRGRGEVEIIGYVCQRLVA